MATWVAVLMLLLSAGPVWASLERILGRSIPRLRYSPAVKRNRVYVAVPVVMGVCWVAVGEMCVMSGGSDGDWRAWCWWFGLGCSAAVGWLVFAGLRLGEGVVTAVHWLARNFG